MTKREYIQLRVRRTLAPTGPIALVAIGIMLFVQFRRLESTVFWISSYTILGILSVMFMSLMMHRLKCPDCGGLLWRLYLSRPVGDSKGEALQTCPHCGSDFAEEMKEETPTTN